MTSRRGEKGSVLPLLLVVLFLQVLMGWVLAGTAAQHYLKGARRSRELLATELAQAGIEAAVAWIQAGSLPPDGRLSGEEETGRYDVAVEVTPGGRYRLRSTGTALNESRTATVEVAPPRPRLLFLAGGEIRVRAEDVLGGGDLVLDGLLHAGGDLRLEAYSTALYGGLYVQGDAETARNAYLSAESDLLALATTAVTGSLAAGGDVSLICERGELGTYNQVSVDGEVAYSGSLTKARIGAGLLADCGISTGSETSPGLVAPFQYVSLDPTYYEALVADLEARGLLETAPPAAACGTLDRHTRVTGDLACSDLRISPGTVVVVDGSLTAGSAEIEGLLYVRGEPEPRPRGRVEIRSLALAQVLGSSLPYGGGGSLAATGTVIIQSASLIALLPAGAESGAVLQVLALATGPEDDQNDLEFLLADLVRGLADAESPPLFLYTAAGGNIRLADDDLADLLAFDRLPLAAVAGGSLTLASSRLAGVATTFTLAAEDAIWLQVPPPLREMARARIIRWEWEPE